MQAYLNDLRTKNVAVVGNHTSLINTTHLVDTLLSYNIRIKKIFAPEHGFRGLAQAGEKVHSEKDDITGIPIVSLYGKHLKPTADDLKDIDIVVFDIQDVGVRFYTYISTLQYVMEACADNGKKLIVLDRPNPNGFYVDGPILEKPFASFVGMQSIPIVYGLTIGEYSTMLVGEKWLDTKKPLDLKIVKCKNYTHSTHWFPKVPPSPNLNSDESILLYPSVCLFEGTNVSLGRGTQMPFTVIGFPENPKHDFSFTPHTGIKNYNPPFNDTLCFGLNLKAEAQSIKTNKEIELKWLKMFYELHPNKTKFFTDFFDTLAGTDKLRLAIINNDSIESIKKSWQEPLNQYKSIRKKYLLYEDFR
ncbi:MAG: DUF1343 domain-containing protein [Bacteroidetes bacterium]|nr:DUF1343 domain-containing protein [Bacteroidota bacterium]